MRYLVITILIFIISCNNKKGEFIKISALYLQYVCGDENDDMRIMTYNDLWIGGLENKEIDPIFINGKEELSEYFFKNKTKSYGMEFTLEGYLDTNMPAGCDNQANKFWITHIEKLNKT